MDFTAQTGKLNKRKKINNSDSNMNKDNLSTALVSFERSSVMTRNTI